MSLINEALKKARVEAAQRDAEKRGVLVPKAAAYQPRRRAGRLAAAAVAAVAALGLAVAGGMWLARRGTVPADGSTVATAQGATPAEAVEPRAEPPVRPAAPDDGVRGPAAATTLPDALDRAGPATPEAPAEPAGAAGRPAGTLAVAPSPAAPPPPAPESEPDAAPAPSPPAAAPDPPEPAAAAPPERQAPVPAPRAAPPDGRSYFREAPLPGGGELRLEGIVWSESTPAAVIDGQIVGPGERIHGVLVLRVERDRVVLDAGGQELVVRLR